MKNNNRAIRARAEKKNARARRRRSTPMPPINLEGLELVADLAQCVDSLAARHNLPEADIMSALFACIASAAVGGGATREQFRDMAGDLYDDIIGGGVAVLPRPPEAAR